MTPIRIGMLGLVVVLGACKQEDAAPKVPAATFLSPQGSIHLGIRFTPDGSHVAYWAPGDDGWDVVVAKGDLSGSRVVSSHNTRTWPMTWSQDGRQLVFAASATNVADLWVVSADSGSARQLTSAAGFEVPTAWSPRGNRVSYNSTSEGGVQGIFLDLATGKSAPVPGPAPLAKWSPDGTRLAFEGFQGKATYVWVADSLGNGAKQLTTDGRETDLAWSPDGTEIVYVSRRTGRGDIWVVPAAGGAPRQLTHDIRDDYQPHWSPDGKWIAFVSERGRQTDVWVVPSAGGTEIRVTDDEAEEGSLQWVGTGLRLGYQTGITGGGIYAVSATGGAERRLTADSVRVGEINTSPTGNEVVFEVTRGGGVSDIQAMSTGGGPARTLVANGATNTIPNWSPDGKSIVFLSTRSGTIDLWVVPAAGGDARQLTDLPGNENNPQWSPDGSAVYFTSRHEGGPFSDLWKVPVAGGPPVRITRAGTISALAVSLVSSDIFVQSEGGKDGRTRLARVTPDGKLETLWDKSNVTGFSWFGYTPKGDSLVINAELPDGAPGSFLISTKTGQGRQVLGKDDQAGDLSRDGRWLAYWTGRARLAIAVMDRKDGTTRQLTKSAENDASYWWAADNTTIVFTRISQRRRIATVDVSKLLSAH